MEASGLQLLSVYFMRHRAYVKFLIFYIIKIHFIRVYGERWLESSER